MEKNNNIKIMGVFASGLLLIIIVTASFAYFGSFNVNLNNNVAVNVNAFSPGDAVFTSNATQLNLLVPAANMSQTAADNETPAAENTATLSVNLTGAEGLVTTCTYDIVYEYDSGSYIYGGTGTKHVSKNGDKEITLQVTNVNGTNNFASEKNFDSTTISNYKNGNVYTLVSGATIESDGTLTTQNINITGKYYNLTISQSSLDGRTFTGKIYVTNHKCETINGMFITTLMSTSTPDVYDENGLRYEGADPNNYICLDNQKNGNCSDSSLLFRIIGLFDEDTSSDGTSNSGSKKLLKVIDTNNYGGTSGKVWNSAGTNNWSNASLKTELNEAYLTALLDISNVNSKLSSAITNAKWYLNGASETNLTTLTTNDLYAIERPSYANIIFAKVGLIYPSDYGYATVGGSTINKTGCREKGAFLWYNTSYSDCPSNDWLLTSQVASWGSNKTEWLLSPCMSRSDISTVLISDYGNLTFSVIKDNQLAVRPTFYLDSSILKIVGGTGTKNDPYRIG